MTDELLSQIRALLPWVGVAWPNDEELAMELQALKERVLRETLDNDGWWTNEQAGTDKWLRARPEIVPDLTPGFIITEADLDRHFAPAFDQQLPTNLSPDMVKHILAEYWLRQSQPRNWLDRLLWSLRIARRIRQGR